MQSLEKSLRRKLESTVNEARAVAEAAAKAVLLAQLSQASLLVSPQGILRLFSVLTEGGPIDGP